VKLLCFPGIDRHGDRRGVEEAAFELPEQTRFSPVDEAFDAGTCRRERPPFFGIHVNHVYDQWDVPKWRVEGEPRHARTEGEDHVRPSLPGPSRERPSKLRRVEQRQCQRSIRRQVSNSAQAVAPVRYRGGRYRGCLSVEQPHARSLDIIMHERKQVHVRPPLQEAEDVVRANPIPAVRGVRQAMCQEPDPHRGRPILADSLAVSDILALGARFSMTSDGLPVGVT
jgi:hypothetical protein